ncbi:MAG: hypothetical protein MRY83_14700 [Flavobacteriales bacterium]|nr:hypothetical protein [Flavobacteriales bacterium]
MRKELEIIELIERYLQGKMTQVEVQQFEEQINNDPDLKESVDLQKNIMERIEQTALLDMMDLEHQKRFGKGSKWKWLKLFSGIAIVGLVGFFIWKNWPSESHETERIQDNVELQGEGGFGNNEAAFDYSFEDSLQDDSLLNEYLSEVLDVQEIDLVEPQTVSQDVIKVKKIKRFIDAQKDNNLEINGTLIHIPSNCMRHENGKLVKGQVEIQYREYKNQSQIMASNYPMTVKENGENKYFNSAGMFEIWAYQKNKKLQLDKKKSIKVDFRAKDLPNTNFYYLEPKTNEWELLSRLADSEVEVYEDAKTEEIPNSLEKEAIMNENTPIDFSKYKYELDLWNCAGCEAQNPLSIEDFKTALDYGIAQYESPQNPPESREHNYPKSLEESFNDPKITQQYNLGDGVNSKIKFVTDKHKYKKIPLFRLKFNGKTNPELRYFRNISFYNLDQEVDLTKYFKNDIIDLRVLALHDDEAFEFKIKLDNGSFEYINLVPVQNNDKKRFLSKSQNRIKWKGYQRALGKKEDKFNKIMQSKIEDWNSEQLDKLRAWKREQNQLESSLFRYSLIWGDTTMVKLSKEKWIGYIKNNRDKVLPQMRNWQTGLAVTPEKRMKDLIDEEIQNKNDWLSRLGNVMAIEGLNQKLRPPSDQSFWDYRNPRQSEYYDSAPVSNEASNSNIASNTFSSTTYTRVIKGLTISKFGVYNCDQANRMKDGINISPIYFDHSGKPIENGKFLVVVDSRLNNAFSYPSGRFACSLVGQNHFFLFTRDNKVYHFNELQWKQIRINLVNPELKMRDVTGLIETVYDVQRLIDLDQSILENGEKWLQ